MKGQDVPVHVRPQRQPLAPHASSPLASFNGAGGTWDRQAAGTSPQNLRE